MGVRFREVDQEVSKTRGEGKAYPDAESCAHRQGGSGQDGVNEIENRGNEEKGELNRFGDPSQERSERRRDQDACCNLGEVRVADHSQAGRGQTEHHDGEEPCHEVSGGGIAREVAVQVAIYDPVRPMIGAKLEPDVEVEHVVQAERDKQAVQKPIDSRTERSESHDRQAYCIDSTLDRRPD